MYICLLESDLKTSKSHANVVSFDENESSLSALMNLYERNEQFLDICVMDNLQLSRDVIH